MITVCANTLETVLANCSGKACHSERSEESPVFSNMRVAYGPCRRTGARTHRLPRGFSLYPQFDRRILTRADRNVCPTLTRAFASMAGIDHPPLPDVSPLPPDDEASSSMYFVRITRSAMLITPSLFRSIRLSNSADAVRSPNFRLNISESLASRRPSPLKSPGRATVMVNDVVTWRLPRSFTITVTVALPSCEGVPLIFPDELMEIPAGALSREYVYGDRPPDADTWIGSMSSCHVTTTSEMEATDSGLLTHSVNVSVSVLSRASVTVTVTVDVLVLLGVPLMRPLVALIEIVKGAPDIENVYGFFPPWRMPLSKERPC